jgi:hypothetical protein
MVTNPPLAPPRHPRGEIDCGIGLLPGCPPQFDRRVFVLGAIGTEREICGHRVATFLLGMI